MTLTLIDTSSVFLETLFPGFCYFKNHSKDLLHRLTKLRWCLDGCCVEQLWWALYQNSQLPHRGCLALFKNQALILWVTTSPSFSTTSPFKFCFEHDHFQLAQTRVKLLKAWDSKLSKIWALDEHLSTPSIKLPNNASSRSEPTPKIRRQIVMDPIWNLVTISH